MFASGGFLSEGYRHSGPGACLGDGQTGDEGVVSDCVRGDALLRRIHPYLTLPAKYKLKQDPARWVHRTHRPQVNNLIRKANYERWNGSLCCLVKLEIGQVADSK